MPPAKVSLEIASEVVSAIQFSAPGNALRYRVLAGTPREILQRYTALTGRPALPPLWSFGLWLGTSFLTDYDEATVSSFVDGMAERDIPLSVFHFDCFWMRVAQLVRLHLGPRHIPGPGRGCSPGCTIADSGWACGSTLPRSALAAVRGGTRGAASCGGVAARSSGVTVWVAGMALVDFTSPAAVSGSPASVRGLLREGVMRSRRTSVERIPADIACFDGSDPALMHNYYLLALQRGRTSRLWRPGARAGEAVVFARSATVGGQQFPVHWERRLRGDRSRDGRVATRRALARSLRLRVLEPRHQRFRRHRDAGRSSSAGWCSVFSSSQRGCTVRDSYRVPWVFGARAVRDRESFHAGSGRVGSCLRLAQTPCRRVSKGCR